MSLTYGFCLGDIDTEYDSAQFSDAFHAVFGNGISPYGAQFELTIGGFTATLDSGYALAAGRWVKNDEPFQLTLPLSGNNADRTDALVVRVDYPSKKASLEVLVNVDKNAILSDPSVLRTDGEYSLVLYLIHVRRGATSLSISDVIDLREDANLCGYIVPLAERSKDVLYVYNFFTVGLNQEEARLIGLSNQVIEKADAAVKKLDADIQASGAAPWLGETMLSLVHPIPQNAWLLCSGDPVPPEYPDLSNLVGGILPDISWPDKRFRTYIYGGNPIS